MKSSVKRLGISTSGGDCPGLNAAIRAVVKYASGRHGVEVVGLRDGLTGLMRDPPESHPLTLAEVEDIHTLGGTILGTSNKGSPFRHPTEGPVALARAQRNFATLGLDALIVIGGDGSHVIAQHLVQAQLPLIGIPKTIDNDVTWSDEAIGFATAVDIAADAALRLRTTAEAHDRLMILEVMGRDSGHIALHAALAAGADAALIPEIPFDYGELATLLKTRQAQGRSAYLLIVAEGALLRGETTRSREIHHGAKLVGGIGPELARELHRRTGIDARATVLGHLQRGGPPNTRDRLLGATFGRRAVDLALARRFGVVLGIRQGVLVEYDYLKVASERRPVDLGCEEVATAEALGIYLGR